MRAPSPRRGATMRAQRARLAYKPLAFCALLRVEPIVGLAICSVNLVRYVGFCSIKNPISE